MSVRAEASANTVQVAVRAAAFVTPPLRGARVVAIIYEAGDPASEREALDIERLIGAGLRVGAMSLTPRRVSSNSLDELAGVRLAFVTQRAGTRQVAAATAARSILTISFDSACARAGNCVLAISGSPRVQIIVSRAAAAAARLRFESSFLLLIKEI